MTLRKLRRFSLIFLISVIGVLALLFASLNLSFSQRFTTRKVNQILAGAKIPVHLQEIRRILPNSVVVQGVLIESNEGDTIVFAHGVQADVSLLALIRKQVIFQRLDLRQASVNLIMNELSRKFNIEEAFTDGSTAKARKKDKARDSWALSIHEGNLSSLHFQMTDSLSGIHVLQDIEGIGLKNFSLLLADQEIRAQTLELEDGKGNVMLALGEKEPKTEPGIPWNYSLSNLDMKDLDVTLDLDQGGLLMHVLLGEGKIRARKMDLPGRVLDIKSIDLEEADISMENRRDAALDSSGADVLLTGLEMQLRDLVFQQELEGLKLRQLSFDLNNGLVLKNLQATLDSEKESTRIKLALETDRSLVNLEGQARESMSGILSEPGEIQNASLSFGRTAVSLKDLFHFFPEWQGNPKLAALASKPLSVTGAMELTNSLLSLTEVSLSEDGNFRLDLAGEVADPFVFSEATGDLNLLLSRVDTSWIKEFLRGTGMGEDIPVPGGLTVEGKVSKSMSSSEFSFAMKSDLGNAGGTGSLDFDTDSFSVRAFLENILLGEALHVKDLGTFSGSAEITGQGFAREDFQGNLNLLVDSLGFKDYQYTRTRITGMFQAGECDLHLVASDSFLTASIDANLIAADSAIRISASGTIAAELDELHFVEDMLSIQTSLNGAFVRNQSSLRSELSVSDLFVANADQRGEIKEIRASFSSDSLNTALKAEGDFFILDIQAKEKFWELDSLGLNYKDYLSTFADPEHAHASTRALSLPEIQATGRITDHKILNILLKDSLFHMDNLDLSMQNLAHENRINYGITGTGIHYRMLALDRLEAALVDSAGGMDLELKLDDVSLFSGPDYDWLLQSSFRNWRSLTSFSVQDPLGPMLYDLEIASRIDSGTLILEVPSKTLLLNRKQWYMDSPDLLSLNRSAGTITPSLSMFTGSSFLHLSEHLEEGKPSYQLDMRQVEMESLVREDLFPGRPDASISGSLRLKILGELERRLESDLHFSQVSYSDLKFDSISLVGHMDYGNSENYAVDLRALLDSAEFLLRGSIGEEGRRQIQSEFSQIPIKTLQPFTRETLSDLRGKVSGRFDASNTSGKNRLDGQLSFAGVRLRINALNSAFLVQDQALFVEDEKLLFNKFRILDTLSNQLLVDGFLDFRDIREINTDLNISSSKLQVMSRGSEDENTPFYGDVFVDSEFSVKGPLVNPSINGNVRLSRGTEVFYRHMEDLSLSESQKILSFESVNSATEDSVVVPVVRRQGTLIRSSMDTKVEIDPSTLIHISLAERIYDLDLQIKGGGRLNYNLLNNNQMSLSGRYEIGEGAAELKLVGWPNKSFRIAQGGYIRWDGRVEDPELSFQALNRVSSSYLNPMDGRQRPVEFDVVLQLTDHLSDLDVLFTVSTGDQYLMSIINTLSPEEHMRQAISILLFEVIDLPGISSTSNYVSQQVNQILASQLNQLTQSAIKGVDISFGLDTYTTQQSGGAETNTSLSYEVRKSLMNDRAHIEVSGRLRDINQPAGATNSALNNISLEYSLDSSATKFLKVYNEHTYEDVFEGEVIKTGIGVFVRKRYRHLSDIWRREKGNKKEPKEKKAKE